MAIFRQQAAAAVTSAAVSDSPIVAEMRRRYPELAEALAPASGDGNGPSARFTCSIFVQDARVRFCLGSREDDVAAFGELEDVSDAFRAIEEAIVTGHLGWKKDRDQKRR